MFDSLIIESSTFCKDMANVDDLSTKWIVWQRYFVQYMSVSEASMSYAESI